MAEICRYVIVDAEDHEQDFEYDTFDEAKADALSRGGKYAIIERKYVYEDSELVWTFDGSLTWPPPTRRM